MKPLKISAVLITAIAISGCSGFFVGKTNAPTPAPIGKTTDTKLVRTVWSTSGLGSSNDTSLRFVVSDNLGTLYVANANGSVSSVNANSGKKGWSKKAGELYTGTATNGSLVFVGTKKGELVAMSTTDGSKVWSQRLYGAPLTAPVIAGSRVVIRSIGGAVETFDAQTGEKSWAYMVQIPTVSIRSGAAPVVVGQNLLVPTDLGLLGYLNADTGAVLWGQKVNKARGGSDMALISDIDAAPVVDENVAFVPVARNGIVALSLKNGQKLWEIKSGVYSGLTLDPSSLYVAYENGNVSALSKRDGHTEWENNSLFARHLTSPILLNGRIVVGDNEGYIHVLDQNSGQLLGSTKVGRSGFMPEVLALGGDAIFQDYSGNIYRISI